MSETSQSPARKLEHPSLLCGGLHQRSPLQPARTAGFSPIHAAHSYAITTTRSIANQMEHLSECHAQNGSRRALSISWCAPNTTQGVRGRSITPENVADIGNAGPGSDHTARLQRPACSRVLHVTQKAAPSLSSLPVTRARVKILCSRIIPESNRSPSSFGAGGRAGVP
jgi:hypothetical protein